MPPVAKIWGAHMDTALIFWRPVQERICTPHLFAEKDCFCCENENCLAVMDFVMELRIELPKFHLQMTVRLPSEPSSLQHELAAPVCLSWDYSLLNSAYLHADELQPGGTCMFSRAVTAVPVWVQPSMQPSWNGAGAPLNPGQWRVAASGRAGIGWKGMGRGNASEHRGGGREEIHIFRDLKGWFCSVVRHVEGGGTEPASLHAL